MASSGTPSSGTSFVGGYAAVGGKTPAESEISRGATVFSSSASGGYVQLVLVVPWVDVARQQAGRQVLDSILLTQ